MSKLIRIVVVGIGLALILLFVNSQTRALNGIVSEGELVLLELRPADPRAFMQGDFMRLAYARDLYPDIDTELSPKGVLVYTRGENNVASFVRVADECNAKSPEVCIAYIRTFRDRADIGAERYFFQEGTAETFEAAEYGMFRTNPAGRAVLVGLADENFEKIEPN